MRDYTATVLFDQRLSDLDRAGLRVTGRMKPADSIVLGDLIAFEGSGCVLILSGTRRSIDHKALAEALGCRTVEATAFGQLKAYAVIEAGVPQPHEQVWLNGVMNARSTPLPEESRLTSVGPRDRHRELISLLSGLENSAWLKGTGMLVEQPRTRRRWFGRTAS
ncbi:hypothetical protein [Luteipulveratus halotolerans]|nr:hypothetical protein [Luteipulveratus halotolerans]